MKVILIKNIPSLGQAADIKEVADGYARNFLIPQGLVKIATETAIKELDNQKSKKLKTQDKKAKQYKEIAKKINNLKIIIKAKASAPAPADAPALAGKKATADNDDKNTLFASITANDIVAELKKRKYDIPAEVIKLDQPIKQLGYYDIELDFSEDVKAKVGLTIKRED